VLEDFWALAPADFFACLRQAQARERRLDWRAGLISAVIANALGRGPNGRPFTPEDFIPKPSEAKCPTPDDLAEKARVITYLFGGRVSA
jgi:hypothetical protein